MENRIFVIVAKEVDSDTCKGIIQPLGRACAQVAHAVRRMQSETDWNMHRNNKSLGTYAQAVKPITTIVLSARNSKELYLVQRLLCDASIGHAYFHDTNKEAYGPGKVLTAIATAPVTPGKVEGVLDHLPLWPD